MTAPKPFQDYPVLVHHPDGSGEIARTPDGEEALLARGFERPGKADPAAFMRAQYHPAPPSPFEEWPKVVDGKIAHSPEDAKRLEAERRPKEKRGQATSRAEMERFVAEFISADGSPTKVGLWGRWTAAGHHGRRDDLYAEFNRQMGDDAPKRGRPRKSPQ